MRRRLLPSLALGLGICASAHADFHAEYELVDPGLQGVSSLSRIELAGSHMRIDAGRVSLLLDAGADKVVMLMHKKKKYVDTKKAIPADASSSAELSKLAPEQRALIEKREAAHMPESSGATTASHVNLKPTGRSDRIHEYACDVYRIEVNGRHKEDLCLASVADVGVSAEDRAALQRTLAQLKAISEGRFGRNVRAPIVAVLPEKFPVKIVRYSKTGEVFEILELKQLTNGGVNAGDFAIPAGYTEAGSSEADAKH